jgi:KDO2-lipid IV(A) lauroyltransferase
MVARHLRRICGPAVSERELDALVAAAFISYGHYWKESFRLADATGDDLEAGMDYEGVEHIEAARAQGRGVILAMPHIGGWDFGGAWLAAAGYEITVVAEPVEPPELFEFFASLRRAMGLRVVALGRDAGSALLHALREGRVLGLVTDRDILRTGVDVEFFGETTKLPAGPATLALRTGAALIPCAVYFHGHRSRRHRGVIRPPLDTSRTSTLRNDVHRISQALAGEFETLIRAAPEQWHVFQPNWPSDPGY